jgi:hypothetical protein
MYSKTSQKKITTWMKAAFSSTAAVALALDPKTGRSRNAGEHLK